MVEKPDVSNEAVKKATGKTWNQWLKTLDDLGAASLAHKDIVLLLKERGLVESSWWRQTVTVGYEKARGLRVLGETADAGFQIGVSKTVAISSAAAWEVITKPAGRQLWLGSVTRMRFEKGVTYLTKEGTTGEVRTVAPGKRIRLTWHPPELKRPSTVQITLTPKGEKTVIGIHQEKLSSARDRAKMKKRWQQVLADLEASL